MPWKYLRISRRCTRDRPSLREEEYIGGGSLRAAVFFFVDTEIAVLGIIPDIAGKSKTLLPFC